MSYCMEILVAFFSFLLICYSFRNKNGLPTNWPLVGMLPAILVNLHRIHNFIVEILEKSESSFFIKGPWFTKMNLLLTADPANVHHIMSKNFANYPKGSKFKEILDFLGDGIFNADSNIWKYHRKIAQLFIGHPNFHHFLIKISWEKVESGLLPVLDHVSKHGLEVDLEDLFGRFSFDTICTFTMGYDPRSLSIDLPRVPPSKALEDVEEVILYRHAVPKCAWKFQRWLGIGVENKYKKAWQTLDDFIYKCISRREVEEMGKKSSQEENDHNDELAIDLLSLYMDESMSGYANICNKSRKFLRDAILSYLIAGRDTTTTALLWFFYLLSKNPQVLSKIKEEFDIVMVQGRTDDEKGRSNYLMSNFEELSEKLVYLHATLCETLRLYPPVVFEAKTPIVSDILPSGHQVKENDQIIFHLYAMARMKSIWGDDCNEFKPERWITEKGKIKHEPSYKFLAFNAGPRTCVGKNMAFIQMKVVATAIIQNYHIQPVEGCLVIPDISIILHMKHGFKVKVLPM